MEKLSVIKKVFVRSASILLTFLLSILCINLVFSQAGSNKSGWYLTNYTLKDGSLSKETVLMGTTSKMKDVISYKGVKGHIEISQNRYGVPKGEHIAGVTYKVSWTDPPAVLIPGEKHFVDFELKTTTSKTWKAGQQSI